MSDLISIIIPAYNIAPYIDRCLKSVLGQTHCNLEIIVINDGSTDDTGMIIDRIAETDERMVVVHREHMGVSEARNSGLDIAHGDYIGFVDGDDEVYPDMFEFLLCNAVQNNADISHCGFELVNPDRTIPINGTGKLVVQTRNESIVSLLEGKLFEPSSCNKLYCREVLEGVHYGVDIQFNEDLLFNLEVFKNCECAVFEDLVKYRYMYNPGSASRSGFQSLRLQSVYTVARRVKSLMKNEPGLSMAVEQFYAEKILGLYKTIHMNNAWDIEVCSDIKIELKKCNGLGIRFRALRILLLYFPKLYDLSRRFYDRIFGHRQKWTAPEYE